MYVRATSTSAPPKISVEKKFWQLGAVTWAALDLVIGGTSMYLAYHLTPASLATASNLHLSLPKATALFSIMFMLTAHAVGLHNNLNIRTPARIVILSLVSAILAIAALSLVVSVALYGQIGRYILLICAASAALLALSARLFIYRSIHASPLRVRVVGALSLIQYLQELTEENPGRVLIQGPSSPEDSCDVVVVSDKALDSTPEAEPYLHLASHGIPVFSVVAFVESQFYRIPAQYISPAWLFSLDLQRLHPFHHEAKRFMDIGLAGVGLILSAPLLLVAAIFIRLESPGPIFYSQIRVGLYQRPFRIWKLRTMRSDAEKDGPQWAKTGDGRVTRVGRILRRTRVDELPQFWNILRGDMAFVGPRPERPQFVEQLAAEIPFYLQRHLVKPGLTGWAQICYPYGASSKDAWNKLSYDFYYMKNFSLLLDFQVLLQTIGAASRGAR